ncbi:MAG: hypothetical protein OXF76_04135 [Caldilineaceae bacterium]|nr:hypothetical protein [Caldilineaceae bacterium]
MTRNEVLYSLHQPEFYIVAIVEFLAEGGHCAHCVRWPFQRKADFEVTM